MHTNIENFDYELPDRAIAQSPAQPRDSARLLDATQKEIQHRYVGNFCDLIEPGDVIVVNNTRVLNARLKLQKETGAKVEVFLLEPDTEGCELEEVNKIWRALVKPSRRVKDGTELQLFDNVDTEPIIRICGDLGSGVRLVEPVDSSQTIPEVAQLYGEIPLPPYIHETLENPERYQTVYSRRPSSVAAPTAGLHLTQELLDQCRKQGAQIVTVDLSVGLGTFRPIMSQDITEHEMHAESYTISEESLEAIDTADRVIAVGTTTVRALESYARSGQRTATTDLFITPGFNFEIVDALWTNFHQPKSSLLVLLASFAGPRWREIYEEALRSHYKFLSFGDAMFVTRHDLLTESER